MSERTEQWLTCYNCSKETRHHVRAFYGFREVQRYEPFRTIDHKYFIVQCAGCDTTSFMHECPLGASYVHKEQYPDPAKWMRSELFLNHDEQWKMPRMIRELYTEVRAAFCEKSSVLAGLGLRTLVEALCIERQIPGGNLMEKIKNLQTQGLISTAEYPIVDKLRQIGNVSAHEIKGMDMDVLEHALQIINHVLRSIYILPALNNKINL